MSARPCDACGVPIRFVPGPNGRLIPLQQLGPLYRVVTDGAAERAERVDDGDLWVSHFRVCPQASRFSRRKPAAPGVVVRGIPEQLDLQQGAPLVVVADEEGPVQRREEE